LKNAATPESLLCRCEDVRCGDVAAADDWLQAKLTQRCGMGACQGRTCAASAPPLIASILTARSVRVM